MRRWSRARATPVRAGVRALLFVLGLGCRSSAGEAPDANPQPDSGAGGDGDGDATSDSIDSGSDRADAACERRHEFNLGPFPSRYASIPAGQTDGYSRDKFPVAVVDGKEWDAATLERLPAPVRSAGVEDAPFISPDGRTLTFTFVGNVKHVVSEPAGLFSDPAVGIYQSDFDGTTWSEPRRLGLVRSGVSAIAGGGSIRSSAEGAEFWFNYGGPATGNLVRSYVAYLECGALSIGYDPGPPVNMPGISAGEPDISADGSRLYLNSPQLAGPGRKDDDIYVFERKGAAFGGPVNLGAPVNTPTGNQNRPFITADGKHLYFDSMEGVSGTGISIFRSDLEGSAWGKPEEMVRNNLGEPALTADGQWLYFVHYYYLFDGKDFTALEADIFRVRRR